jgi:hypothetical protein
MSQPKLETQDACKIRIKNDQVFSRLKERVGGAGFQLNKKTAKEFCVMIMSVLFPGPPCFIKSKTGAA